MESNVLSWQQALRLGCEPRDYPYATEAVPLGVLTARLDFKIWAKKAIGLNCYFTCMESGKNFQLTVYRRHDGHSYMLDMGTVDFRTCPAPGIYKIETGLNGKGNIRFIAAEFIAASS